MSLEDYFSVLLEELPQSKLVEASLYPLVFNFGLRSKQLVT
jgi:hypothetical protein